MVLKRFANSAETTLTAPVSVGATSISVLSRDAFPAEGDFFIRVNDELMLVTGGAATTNWTVQRGEEGTTEAAHSAGAAVVQVLTAGVMNTLAILTDDPGADRIPFWDDSAGQVTWLTAGSGLSISGTTLTADGTAPGGGDTNVQVNDGGAFGGSADLTFDGTALRAGNGTSKAIQIGGQSTTGFTGNISGYDSSAPVIRTNVNGDIDVSAGAGQNLYLGLSNGGVVFWPDLINMKNLRLFSGTPTLSIDRNDPSVMNIAPGAGTSDLRMIFDTAQGAAFVFAVSGTERVRIASDGSVQVKDGSGNVVASVGADGQMSSAVDTSSTPLFALSSPPYLPLGSTTDDVINALAQLGLVSL